MSECSSMIERRRIVAGGAGAALLALTSGIAAAAPASATELLPAGHRRGRIVTTVESTPVYEVLREDGRVAGYTLAAADLRRAQAAAGEVHLEVERAKGVATTDGITSVAACGAGILWFVAQTVFPSVKLAALAVRLGRLVAKYGARTVARIFLGARGIAGRTAEREIIDLAKALSGVAALAACGL